MLLFHCGNIANQLHVSNVAAAISRAVFKKYDVTVYRPKVLENYNQIFSRDIAFCIDDKIIKANILPDREKEYEAIGHVLAQINPENIIELPLAFDIYILHVAPFASK